MAEDEAFREVLVEVDALEWVTSVVGIAKGALDFDCITVNTTPNDLRTIDESLRGKRIREDKGYKCGMGRLGLRRALPEVRLEEAFPSWFGSERQRHELLHPTQADKQLAKFN